MMAQLVVGFDGSKQALAALRWAADEAERWGGEVHVVQSWREPLVSDRAWIDIWEDPDAGLRAVLEELDASVAAVSDGHPSVRFSTEVVGERPARALIEASQDAAMVVVGARGRGGFVSLLLGSVSRRVAADAASTVVVVRGDEGEGDGDVVVGVDGSEPSRIALRWAADEARRRGSRLHVVLAWSYLLPEGEHGPEAFRPDYSEADARRAVRAITDDVLGADPGIEVKLDAPCELAAKALIERAEHASLVVVGSRGRSNRATLGLGSISAQVLQHSPCPVAVVPSPVREEP